MRDKRINRTMTKAKIVELLAERGRAHLQEKRRKVVSFADAGEYSQQANELISDLDNYPHAFVIACVTDRQIKAERAWAIPYHLQERIGSFKFEKLRNMDKEMLSYYFNNPNPLHRYREEIPKCVHDAIQIIKDDYDGDASKIWSGKPRGETVVRRFQQIRGVGPKIATMAASLLARDFKIEFKDYSIDISPDVHIQRVFYRLGLTDEEKPPPEKIIARARELYSEPWLLDSPCWHIGKDWCKAKNPQCDQCYMKPACPTAGMVGRGGDCGAGSMCE